MAGEVSFVAYCAALRCGDIIGELDANGGAQQDIEERKPRKSVAFSEGTTIVDENGDVTQQANGAEGSKDSAMSHSASMLAVHVVAHEQSTNTYTRPGCTSRGR